MPYIVPTEGNKKYRVCVGGGAGFIGSHLAKELKSQGHWVRCADWKENEFMNASDFCDEFMLIDLRSLKVQKLYSSFCFLFFWCLRRQQAKNSFCTKTGLFFSN